MKKLNSLRDLISHLERVAPELIDLALAKDNQEFSTLLDIFLERAAAHVEANARSFFNLDEVGLSAVVATYFNGMPGIQVIQEGHSNGHVDLTVTVNLVSPTRRVLAEAKIESGPAYHEKGLAQLLGRYSTGRYPNAWLLVYVKSGAIKTRLEALRQHLDTTKPLNQTGKCRDHPARWFFMSDHIHASQEQITVTHAGFNLAAGA